MGRFKPLPGAGFRANHGLSKFRVKDLNGAQTDNPPAPKPPAEKTFGRFFGKPERSGSKPKGGAE